MPPSFAPLISLDPSISALIRSDATLPFSDHTHSMVTRLRDGTSKTLVRTDGTFCYPLPRALAAHLTSFRKEPTFFFDK